MKDLTNGCHSTWLDQDAMAIKATNSTSVAAYTCECEWVGWLVSLKRQAGQLARATTVTRFKCLLSVRQSVSQTASVGGQKATRIWGKKCSALSSTVADILEYHWTLDMQITWIMDIVNAVVGGGLLPVPKKYEWIVVLVPVAVFFF